jgi:hypothetical protein
MGEKKRERERESPGPWWLARSGTNRGPVASRLVSSVVTQPHAFGGGGHLPKAITLEEEVVCDEKKKKVG